MRWGQNKDKQKWIDKVSGLIEREDIIEANLLQRQERKIDRQKERKKERKKDRQIERKKERQKERQIESRGDILRWVSAMRGLATSQHTFSKANHVIRLSLKRVVMSSMYVEGLAYMR